MVNFNLDGYVEHCLNRMAVEIGARPAGSRANRAAASFIAGEMKQAGCQVIWQEYPCPDWRATACELTVAGQKIVAVANTYSPPCDIEAELVSVSTAEDLANTDLTNKIAVVHGEITGSSFLPKNFDRNYYVVESQDRFMELLVSSNPMAVITVSHYDSPYPVLVEDSDFTIPSATVSKPTGLMVVQNTGATARLKIDSATEKGAGANIIGRHIGNGGPKILVCAHYDTKPDTPGALDNASGMAALLLLARLLGRPANGRSMEYVAYGGEDSWWPGDALYIEEYPPDNVAAVVNIDGVGLKEAKTAVAFFACPEGLADRVMDMAKSRGEFVAEQWYASDHGFFWPRGIPTLAFTTTGCMDLVGKVAHTENDTPDLLDNRRIEQTAQLVRDIILMLDASLNTSISKSNK
ncbi:MAG: M28 family metallopeptidase [Firmicutes bacterium]|nr:M28 family metallopeptidase [Bacillota bacterium]